MHTSTADISRALSTWKFPLPASPDGFEDEFWGGGKIVNGFIFEAKVVCYFLFFFFWIFILYNCLNCVKWVCVIFKQDVLYLFDYIRLLKRALLAFFLPVDLLEQVEKIR